MKRFRVEAQVILEVEIDEEEYLDNDEESLKEIAGDKAEFELFGFDEYYINNIEEI